MQSANLNAQDELQAGRPLDPQVDLLLRRLQHPMELKGLQEIGSLGLLPQVVEVRSSSTGQATVAIIVGPTTTLATTAQGLRK